MFAFLAELRRRNVLRVAAAYLVAAWLIVQVAATLFPVFDIDARAVRVVVLLLAIGFLPALALSWAFELTPEGLRRDRGAGELPVLSTRTIRRFDQLIMAALAVALAFFAFDRFVLSPAREAARIQTAREEGHSAALTESFGEQSIAVLPFADLSPGHDQEYFADGIAEQLLDLLAKIPELRVISRSSAFSYKGKDIKLAAIARELNVAHILEGSVRRAGERVRVTAQLIDARSDTQLWSQTYDRTMTDIFAVQDEIAAGVVEQLKLRLLGAPPTVRKTDPEAYALAMQARFYGRAGTDAGLEQSIALYRQVLAIDPNYAPGWAGLARSCELAVMEHLHSVGECNALAREALEKALAIDPANAEAHAMRAWRAMRSDRDLDTAATHLARALTSEPESPDALRAASALLSALGRHDEAIATARYVLRVDPVTPTGYNNLAFDYRIAGRFEEAIAASRSALRLSPQMKNQHAAIGQALLFMGKADAALEEMRLEQDDGARLLGIASAQFARGDRSASDAALRQLIDRHAADHPHLVAMACAYRGESDAAFEWLEKSLAAGEPSDLYDLNSSLWLRGLHGDPRWLPLLVRVGVDPARLAGIEFAVSLPRSAQAPE